LLLKRLDRQQWQASVNLDVFWGNTSMICGVVLINRASILAWNMST